MTALARRLVVISSNQASVEEINAVMLEVLSISLTSISFFQKVAAHLASAIACALMPHMMAYVSKFIELT